MTAKDKTPAKDGALKSAASAEADEAPLDGRPLVLLRHARDLTQEELARRSGVSTRTLSRVENGDTLLDPAVKEEVARGLGLPGFVFDDVAQFLAYLDRMAGKGGWWNAGRWRGTPVSDLPTDEIAEDPARTAQWQRYLEDTLLADAAGRSVREIVLRVLARLPDPPLRGRVTPPGGATRGDVLPTAGGLLGCASMSSGGSQPRFSRITVDPQQMDGVPCIRGLRIPVATVVGMVADGMVADEILDAYPDLQPEDVREALQYAAEAVRERTLPLADAG